jgi:6-pyruvoyltetrahydropterin/6-carboxytetrahydropterin synthase
MILLTRQVQFSAGHRYFLPDLSDAENTRLYGLCANPNGHGHDYRCEVTVGGEIDPDTGMVLNITDLKRLLHEVVVEPLDGEFLTIEHPVCRGRVPTSENLVRYVWQGVEHGLRLLAAREPSARTARLQRVRLAENRWLCVECLLREESPIVLLTRSYEFSAAHRLHSARLSDERNHEIFGKCNNPYGHGHNYVLEVTVQGDVDERTGMMVDLTYLDGIVEEHVVRRYDHKNLNLDVPEFMELNPTSENLVKMIWDRLAPYLKHPPLYRITVRETDRNAFSYYGGAE